MMKPHTEWKHFQHWSFYDSFDWRFWHNDIFIDYNWGVFENFTWVYSNNLVIIKGDALTPFIELVDYYISFLEDFSIDYNIYIENSDQPIEKASLYKGSYLNKFILIYYTPSDSNHNLFKNCIPYPVFKNKEEYFYIEKTNF